MENVKISDYTGIPPLHVNGKMHTSSQDKAKIRHALNDSVSSVSTPDRNNDELPSIDESPFLKLACKLLESQNSARS